MLESLQTVSRQSPWHAIGVWQFIRQSGPTPWHRSPLMASFLAGLRSVMSDPAGAPIAYQLTAEVADAVRRTEPSDSPLWRLMPEQSDAPDSGAQAPV
jgi:hypothetical protein